MKKFNWLIGGLVCLACIPLFIWVVNKFEPLPQKIDISQFQGHVTNIPVTYEDWYVKRRKNVDFKSALSWGETAVMSLENTPYNSVNIRVIDTATNIKASHEVEHSYLWSARVQNISADVQGRTNPYFESILFHPSHSDKYYVLIVLMGLCGALISIYGFLRARGGIPA